ncbi:MAG: hypothetical protein D6678_05055 [Zetaproteobacteria bacterium]|nr:MAG: hypothetical protein D6678_05055 [Zetaproteobacteria bacterium]
MDMHAEQLLSAAPAICYLYGEDRDAVFELAERLLRTRKARRLRVDVADLDDAEEALRGAPLFGPTACDVLVRNAEQATPKQGERLLKLARAVSGEDRLIICAPEMSWKKALHKQLCALERVGCCRLRMPDEAGFARWLAQQCAEAGFALERDALAHAAERLYGMRGAARQWIERLRWYRGAERGTIDTGAALALLGERHPPELERWCHAVAMRRAGAVGMARQLTRAQGASGVQMIAWLGMRMQQLLLYRWYRARRSQDALRDAGVFGEARRRVPREAQCWQAGELIAALARLVEVERKLKGASLEDDATLLERLTLDLVRGARG